MDDTSPLQCPNNKCYGSAPGYESGQAWACQQSALHTTTSVASSSMSATPTATPAPSRSPWATVRLLFDEVYEASGDNFTLMSANAAPFVLALLQRLVNETYPQNVPVVTLSHQEAIVAPIATPGASSSQLSFTANAFLEFPVSS